MCDSRFPIHDSRFFGATKDTEATKESTEVPRFGGGGGPHGKSKPFAVFVSFVAPTDSANYQAAPLGFGEPVGALA